MDAEFHPFHALATLPLEVHVKITDLQLRELPLERGWLHSEIAQGTDSHVATDAGKAVEK